MSATSLPVVRTGSSSTASTVVSQQTEKELREDHFGEELWARLDPGARTFIATAESFIETIENDDVIRFLTGCARICEGLEVQANILLRDALMRVRPQDRMANVEGGVWMLRPEVRGHLVSSRC